MIKECEIKEIFYIDGGTYFTDYNGNDITVYDLSFTEAFDLAKKFGVSFNHDGISDHDLMVFSQYMVNSFDVNSEVDNRDIIEFFGKCEELGIRNILKKGEVFGKYAVYDTINNIIDDYNKGVLIDNIIAYGTDTYIASIMINHLDTAYMNQKEMNLELLMLKSFMSNDDYDLDLFLKILETFSNGISEKENKGIKVNRLGELYRVIKYLYENDYGNCEIIVKNNEQVYFMDKIYVDEDDDIFLTLK